MTEPLSGGEPLAAEAPLVRLNVAARVTGLTHRQLRDRIKGGEIMGFRVGRAYMLRLPDVAAYLARHRVVPPGGAR